MSPHLNQGDSYSWIERLNYLTVCGTNSHLRESYKWTERLNYLTVALVPTCEIATNQLYDRITLLWH